MTVVLKDDYWHGMVEYYYKNIQPNDDSKSIWQWIVSDFNCKGSLHSKILQFSSEQDLTAFRLTIPKN